MSDRTVIRTVFEPRSVVRTEVETRAVTRTVGIPGKSAYQSYLDTTTDVPPKTEAEWSVGQKGDKGDPGPAGAGPTVPGPPGPE